MNIRLPLEGLAISMPYINDDGVAILCTNGMAFEFSNEEIRNGAFEKFHIFTDARGAGVVKNDGLAGEYRFELPGVILDHLHLHKAWVARRSEIHNRG